MTTPIRSKKKIDITVQAKLKLKSLLDVHDNLMKIIHGYEQAKKNQRYQNQYKLKLINQSNISQFFLQALNQQMNANQKQIISKNNPIILQDLNNIKSKNDPFLDKVLQNYRKAVSNYSIQTLQFPQELKEKPTQEETAKFLLQAVQGINKNKINTEEWIQKQQEKKKKGELTLDYVQRKGNPFQKQNQDLKMQIQNKDMTEKKQNKETVQTEQILNKGSQPQKQNQNKDMTKDEIKNKGFQTQQQNQEIQEQNNKKIIISTDNIIKSNDSEQKK